MTVAGIHHVTLLVDDKEQAAWFYGEVLGLEEKGRPAFDFPGLFYWAGDHQQEVHLIVTARPLDYQDLFIRGAAYEDVTLAHVHRHAAFLVPDVDAYEQRLQDHGCQVLFSETMAEQFDDDLTKNMVESWGKMYGRIPVFCLDPFKNLLEFHRLPKVVFSF